MKRLSFPLLALLIIFLPATGTAQTAQPVRQVAVLPFTGETTDSINAQFRELAVAEIQNIPGNFQATAQNLPAGASARDFPPDSPPPPNMVGNRQYAVTGVTSLDDWEYHLQMWLWDMAESTLVYTDEMVCKNLEQAKENVPFLVTWIFSNIPPIPAPPSQPPQQQRNDTPPPPAYAQPEAAPPAATPHQPLPAADESKWFWAGWQVGGSIRQYAIPGNAVAQVPYTDKQSLLSPSFDAAVHGAFQILPFLALQGEVMFTMDFVSFPTFNYKQGGNNTAIVESTAKLQYMSLMFPLLLKFTFTPSAFLISPYGGAYYTLPLGEIAISSPWEAEYKSESLPYSRELPLGWLAGLTLGMKMDQFKKGLPGRLFADIRFAADLDQITFDRTPGKTSSFIEPFRRSMLTVNVGYEIGLLDRK